MSSYNKKNKELLEAEKEINKEIVAFCKKNDITKRGKTYSFKLGNNLYRVSDHKLELTGTKNNYTRYEPFKGSSKNKINVIYIYDDSNDIINIYNKLAKEHIDKLNKLLAKQGKDDEEC